MIIQKFFIKVLLNQFIYTMDSEQCATKLDIDDVVVMWCVMRADYSGKNWGPNLQLSLIDLRWY